MPSPQVHVVNMTPQSLSGEAHQDSEPQLAVNPEKTLEMVGTAFTPDPSGGPNSPLYASVDGGNTWTLVPLVPVTQPDDQSVRFGGGSTLYATALSGQDLKILRSSPYSVTALMQTLVQRTDVDQPYLAALSAGGKDRVFTGNTASSRATLEHSADARTAPPPAGFKRALLDPRSQHNSPSVRAAVHPDGTVYAAYVSWHQSPPQRGDVVVARDNAFGTGGAPFTALTDSGGLPGVLVATSVPIPWFKLLGLQRVGSALSIAVDPANSSTVYVVWGDGPSRGSTQTLRVRRSKNRGATWSGTLISITNATNPALAMTDNRKLGLLYQRVTTANQSKRWQTRVRVTADDWATPGLNILLADTPVDNATHDFDPYIGDYADLQAVGPDLFGVFSAHNLPDLANFPHGVVYQRNHDFARGLLLDLDQRTSVPESIDPFFFHLSQL